MTTAILDTLRIVEEAKCAGFTESQAKFHAHLVTDLLDSQIATKQDLKDLEYRTDLKFAELKNTIIYWAVPVIIGQIILILTVMLRMIR